MANQSTLTSLDFSNKAKRGFFVPWFRVTTGLSTADNQLLVPVRGKAERWFLEN